MTIETIKLIFWAVIGVIVGLTAADIDLAPPLPLKHRSAWTHGPLVPFLVLLGVQAYPGAWSFCAAFLGAYSLHLVADLFPGGWRGSALINLFPIPLSLPPLFSILYLLTGIAGAAWAAAKIMDWPLLAWLGGLWGLI